MTFWSINHGQADAASLFNVKTSVFSVDGSDTSRLSELVVLPLVVLAGRKQWKLITLGLVNWLSTGCTS